MGEISTAPSAVDGELDCSGTDEWFNEALLDPTVPGAPSSDDAIGEALAPLEARHGGIVEMTTETSGSLLVDGREVAVVLVSESPAGGWVTEVSRGCTGYEYAS